MTLQKSEEEDVKVNNRRITALFRIIQTAAAALIVWLVSITYNEVKGSVQNQIVISEQLKSIQSALATVQTQSKADHDELIRLKARLDFNAEKSS